MTWSGKLGFKKLVLYLIDCLVTETDADFKLFRANFKLPFFKIFLSFFLHSLLIT